MHTQAQSIALVLGANGRFGQAAVHAFAAAGWRVFAQARRRMAYALPPNAEALDIPLARAAELAARAGSARVVLHALNPLYTEWEAQALPLLRQGLDVAERLGARFMLPGNVYNYGVGMPPLLNARTPQRPTTRKGELRCAMEAELRARPGLRSVVIRAGDFYGVGSGSWFDLVIAKSLRQGKLVYPGPLDVPHAWAYLPDLARAFVAVAARHDAPAFDDLPFAGHTLTGRELLAAIESAAADLGLRPERGFRHGTMPWGAMRLASPFVPMWREILQMRYLWTVPHALDGGALRAAVGELPTTPLPLALRESLRSACSSTAATSAAAVSV